MNAVPRLVMVDLMGLSMPSYTVLLADLVFFLLLNFTCRVAPNYCMARIKEMWRASRGLDKRKLFVHKNDYKTKAMKGKHRVRIEHRNLLECSGHVVALRIPMINT